MTGSVKHVCTFAGVALIGVHAAMFPVLGESCKGTSLQVRIKAPSSAEHLTLRVEIPKAIQKRVKTYLNGKPANLRRASAGPGMHRAEWRVRYKGGFERRVGFTQLVGPFQNLDKPACAARLFVGQSFIDDGKASPGTAVAMVKKIILKEMKDFSQWPVGKFDKITELRAQWVGMDNKKWSEDLHTTITFENLKDLPSGYFGLSAKIRLDDGAVNLKIAILPRIKDKEIDLKAYVNADVTLDNRVYNWVAHRFDIDDRVGSQVQDEMRDAMKDVFTLPPPVPLPGNRKLTFIYCPGGKLRVKDNTHVMIPVALHLDGAHPGVLPVSLGRVNRDENAPRPAPLTFEFELEAINAVLYYLWHTNFLDEQLKNHGRIEERFNKNSIVKELLSIRLQNVRLSLPPTATATGNPKVPFQIAAAATMDIRDGKQITKSHIYSTIGFDFKGSNTRKAVARLTFRDLEVTCEPEPGLLKPCFSDIVEVMRQRSDALHGELTRQFTDTFNKLVLDRYIGNDDSLAGFVTTGAKVSATPMGRSGVIRVDVFGKIKED